MGSGHIEAIAQNVKGQICTIDRTAPVVVRVASVSELEAVGTIRVSVTPAGTSNRDSKSESPRLIVFGGAEQVSDKSVYQIGNDVQRLNQAYPCKSGR